VLRFRWMWAVWAVMLAVCAVPVRAASEGGAAVNAVRKNGGEWSDVCSATPGETVECRCEARLEGGREYTLRSRMSRGVEFCGLTTLRVNGSDVNSAFYTLLPRAGTFELHLAARFSSAARALVELEYTVRLNGYAVSRPEVNTCAVEILAGDDLLPSGESAGIETWALSVFRGVAVSESGRQANPLPGACFSLYRDAGMSGRVAFADKGGHTYLACTGEECGHGRHAFLLRIPEDGTVRLEGLGAGTYYLQEERTPQGYRAMASALEIVISPEGEITAGGVPARDGVMELIEPAPTSAAEKKEPDPLAFYTNGCRIFAAGLAVMLLERRRLFR